MAKEAGAQAPKPRATMTYQEVRENLLGRDKLLALREEVKMHDEDLKKIGDTLKVPKGERLDGQKIASLASKNLIGAEGELNGTLNVLFGTGIEHDPKAGKEQLKALRLGAEYKLGDRIAVNFRGNEDAYWNIGAGDMMGENVRKVKIIDDKGVERVSTMRQGLKGGFFDAHGYIPVFDNYVIEVLEVYGVQKMKAYKQNRIENEKEELQHLDEIYRAAPGAGRGKMRPLRAVFEQPELRDLDHWVDKAMADLGLDPQWKGTLYSFMKHESSFRLNTMPATSTAWGLFQLLRGKKEQRNYRWTYNELASKMRSFTGRDFSYEQFRDSLEGQVYAGILYFIKSDLAPVKRALGREPEPSNLRDNYLLYVAHNQGPGGLKYHLRTGDFLFSKVGGYAWSVAHGAMGYRQQLEQMNASAHQSTERAATLREALKTDIKAVACVGDSLMHGVCSSGAMEGAGHFGIDRESVAQVLARFGDILSRGYKTVALLVGVNDLASERSAETVENGISEMVKKAHEKGVKVVLCTLPPWGDYIARKFAGRPDAAAHAQRETEKLNNWICAQKGRSVNQVVDLYAAMGDSNDPARQSPQFARSDGLHQSRAGSALVAELIKKEGGIA